MDNQELYQKNLALIGKIYPNYVSRISSAPETGAYEITPYEDSAYLCQRTSGDTPQWIHGPEDPWKASEETITGTEWQTAGMFLVIRPGLGYVPHSLYPNMRKGRFAQRMLIIEDRIDLFRRSLSLFDWTDVLRSDRTILMLEDDVCEACLRFFQTNPVSLLPEIDALPGVVVGDGEVELMNRLQETLTQLSQTVVQASQEYLNDMSKHYEGVPKDNDHKTKVLLVEPEHDYLARPIAQAFEGEHCIVGKFEGNQRILNFLNPFVWLVYCREHFPDVLLWMNRNTLSPEGVEHLKQFPIKKVLWFMDSPKRVETSKEELEATDAYFSFDPTYLPYLKELGGKEGYYLPTAVGIQPLPECEPGKSRPKQEGAPVGFLGALAANRFQDVRDFWLGRDPEFVTLMDGIVEDYLADRSVSLEERFDRSPARERLPYQGFVVLYLEERATYLHRLRTLKTAKDFGLKTYGAVEWGQSEWAEDLASCYTGQTPHYESELPYFYYHTQININVFHVQCVNSTNPRVYDVLAAGGFLLTEYRPAIEDEFTIGTHLDCFRNREELQEKLEYYTTHPEERERIAIEGQKHVLEHATYQKRVQTILDILQQTEC